MPTLVRSHAKINLGLYLGAPRPDGFHSLTTVYQTLEIHDIVTVTAVRSAQTTLHLSSNDSHVPTDERNTAWKMVELALDDFHFTAAVDIHIDKRLPIQGGLGAGSANAVAALVGLERELDVGGCLAELLSPERMAERLGIPESDPILKNTGNWPVRQLELAEKVGSDVPLFLVGGAVLGRDHGQSVFPLPDFEPVWCLVVVPEIGVSTAQAFRDWDALCATAGLTAESSDDRLEELSRAYASAFRGAIPEGGSKVGSSGVLAAGEDLAGPNESALVRTGITSWIENDFERVVFPQHPSLAEIKRLLAGAGTPEAALLASLSGSGSALFGLYKTRGDAQAAQDRIERESQTLKVRNTVVTRTLPRAAYWDQMLKDSF
jgi:4-diphosphocytidyl-2-C-methyl-D-erythritol kinase